LVSQATGIHANTIAQIRDNENANPTYRILSLLSDYLSGDGASASSVDER
jgi:hypothetical protein